MLVIKKFSLVIIAVLWLAACTKTDPSSSEHLVSPNPDTQFPDPPFSEVPCGNCHPNWNGHTLVPDLGSSKYNHPNKVQPYREPEPLPVSDEEVVEIMANQIKR